jgi:hypothetical protein
VPDEYRVSPTSRSSAVLEDISLSDESGLTRRILRVTLVDNVHDNVARVQACIMHQRRSSRSSPWEDVDSYNLAHLRAGQEVRLKLDAQETLKLYETLQHQYAITEEGIPRRSETLRVVSAHESYIASGRARDVIERLLEQEGPDVWDILNEMRPELLHTLALREIFDERKRTVEEFEQELARQEWKESEWQAFLKKHKWILGHGLVYQFLDEIVDQPYYGARNISGAGDQRGDFLMATRADARFTVLVEIKKPQSPLVGSLYRNGVYSLGDDVVGGVSQVQTNIRTWVIDGSRQEDTIEKLRAMGVSPVEPKGLLVVGHTGQLNDSAKKSTFQLFRRCLHNPEIITYDELLARAKFLISEGMEGSLL